MVTYKEIYNIKSNKKRKVIVEIRIVKAIKVEMRIFERFSL